MKCSITKQEVEFLEDYFEKCIYLAIKETGESYCGTRTIKGKDMVEEVIRKLNLKVVEEEE